MSRSIRISLGTVTGFGARGPNAHFSGASFSGPRGDGGIFTISSNSKEFAFVPVTKLPQGGSVGKSYVNMV